MKRRDLVVLVFLVIAVAALGLWLSRPGLASEVEKIGGKVIVEPETAEGRTVSVVFVARPIVDANLACLRGQRDYQRLFLDSTRVSGDCLGNLEGSKALRWLSLGGCPVTDDGLKHLPALPELELLNLSQTRVTDAGLAHLNKLQGLQHLFLFRTAVTDAGLQYLKSLPQLEELDARQTKVTPEGIRRLQESLPKLTNVQYGMGDDD